MSLSTWDDFKKWWTKSNLHSPAITDAYQHHPVMSAAMDVGNSIISVIHIPSMQYVYTSPNFAEWTGWPESQFKSRGVEFTFSRVHPQDQGGLIEFSKIINARFKDLSNDRKFLFKSFWDYRVKPDEGNYFRLLQQDCALKYNADGTMEELMVFATKIQNVIVDTRQHLRMTDGIENLFYQFDYTSKMVTALPNLTTRELEIAKLIGKSFSLKQIASKLGISFNTVKVHSANMMAKLQVNDSVELVNLLSNFKFI
jgi:DNA-binding CsgD family transcriptional regulator